MKKLLAFALLSAIAVGCSNQPEPKDVNQEEEINNKEDINTEQAKEVDKKTIEEEVLKEKSPSEKTQTTAGNEKTEKNMLDDDKDNKSKQASDDQIQTPTKENIKTAENLVSSYLRVGNSENIKVQYDYQNGGKLVVHAFETVGADAAGSHTATIGWFEVDLETSEIEELL